MQDKYTGFKPDKDLDEWWESHGKNGRRYTTKDGGTATNELIAKIEQSIAYVQNSISDLETDLYNLEQLVIELKNAK